MKHIIKFGLLLLGLQTFNSVEAQLLVIKKAGNQFAALDANDEKNKGAIAEIFTDYQWPMVIANGKLKEAEQNALLTAGVPNAEEDFFRTKVKEVNPNYDVIFIPTSLYELFLMSKYESAPTSKQKNPYQALGERGSIIVDQVVTAWNNRPPKNLQDAYQQFYGKFQSVNAAFYPNAFMFINNGLAATLLSAMPELKQLPNALAISNYIQATAYNVAATLIKRIPSINTYARYVRAELPKNESAIKPDSVIAKVISLEYEARAMNKALLLRGSSPIGLKTEKEEKEGMNLLGSAIVHGTYYAPATSVSSIASAYKGKSLEQLSVSLANSLFAALVYDPGACTFDYLGRLGVGYGIFINKGYYYRNQFKGPTKSLDLFVITPMSDLAAFFALGTLFHPRTKVAKDRWDERVMVAPYLNRTTTDPFGVFTTVRDPLLQARLFSQYLAKNMTIIKKGDDSNLLPVEQRVYEAQIKSAQEEAARQFAIVQRLQPVAARFAERTRERVRARKPTAVALLTADEINNRKQQLLSRLKELQDVAHSNKLAAMVKQVDFARELIQEQPYNANVLSIVVDALQAINGKAKIKYFGQTTDISFLLEPIIDTINRDIKRLRS